MVPLLAAIIGVRMKGQGGDASAEPFAAHDEADRRTDRRISAFDKPHGDRRADARPKAARGDDADCRALRRDDLRAFARRRPPVRPQPNALPARPVRERVPDALDARKTAFESTALLDRPGERRLDGIDAFVEFVAIEAEP